MDWDTLIGPDQFPHVAPAELKSPSASFRPYERARPAPPVPRPKKRQKVRRAAPAASYRCAQGASTSSTSWHDLSQLDTRTSSGPSPPRHRPPRPPAPYHDPRPLLPTALPAIAAPLALDSAHHPFLPDLIAFLSSFHSTREHGPTARALVAIGIDSLAALALLLVLEPSSLELLYEHLRRTVGLGPLDVAWLKKAVGAARDAFAKGG